MDRCDVAIYPQRLLVGRLGLERATNGLLVPTESLSDQAKRLAETPEPGGAGSLFNSPGFTAVAVLTLALRRVR